MIQRIVNFEAQEQTLTLTGGVIEYASHTVEYVKAVFDLQANWGDFQTVRAIWQNGDIVIEEKLIGGECIVPAEVLSKRGIVKVNLSGTNSADNIITERLTTYPIAAFIIGSDALVNGDNNAPIPADQYERFVAEVAADADRAEQAAANAGYMFFYIDENGDLIYQRTPNTQVDFYLDNGDLYVEAVNG